MSVGGRTRADCESDPIHIATNGDVKRMNYILDDPVNRIVDSEGRNALHRAVLAGQKDMVDDLLKNRGADPNLQDKNGRAALHLASWNRPNRGAERDRAELEIIDLLLQQPSIDIELRTVWGDTPLQFALFSNESSLKKEVVMKCIQHGASVTDIDAHKNTALHLLVMRNVYHLRDFARLANEILSIGKFDIDRADIDGNTALMNALRECNNDRSTDVVKYLIDRGAKADIRNAKGETALHVFYDGPIAATDVGDGVFSAIDLVLQKSPNIINATDESGFTPLHRILSRGWKNCPKHDADSRLKNIDACTTNLLARENIAINKKTNDDQYTPLHMACKLSCPSLSIVKRLCEKGADPNEQDAKGNTALHYACTSFGSWEVTKFLLTQGENQSQTINKEGLSPLMAAAKANVPVDSLFKMLLHTGGTMLRWKQITTSRKRCRSAVFHDYEMEEQDERRLRQCTCSEDESESSASVNDLPVIDLTALDSDDDDHDDVRDY